MIIPIYLCVTKAKTKAKTFTIQHIYYTIYLFSFRISHVTSNHIINHNARASVSIAVAAILTLSRWLRGCCLPGVLLPTIRSAYICVSERIGVAATIMLCKYFGYGYANIVLHCNSGVCNASCGVHTCTYSCFLMCYR